MPLAGSLTTGILFTTAALAFAGLARGGFSVNHMDIAPKYAGIVMGISNTAGTLAGRGLPGCCCCTLLPQSVSQRLCLVTGVVGVKVTGSLLQRATQANPDGLDGWWTSFLAAAAQCVAGSFAFIMFARGERLFGAES